MKHEFDVTIDKNALDLESLSLPQIIYDCGVELAGANLRVDQLTAKADKAHEEVKKIRSQLILKANEGKTIDIDGKEVKNTMQTVEAFYRCHPDHQEAKENLQEAKEKLSEMYLEKNKLQSALSALHTKKKSLENLINLHQQQYFSSPAGPKDINREWKKELRKRQQDNIIKKAKDRRRKIKNE